MLINFILAFAIFIFECQTMFNSAARRVYREPQVKTISFAFAALVIFGILIIKSH